MSEKKQSIYDDSSKVPNEKEFEKLAGMLRELPFVEPPSGLASSVLRRIRPKNQPLWRRLYNFATTRRAISFSPMQLSAATLCLFLAFFLGFWAGKDRIPHPIKDMHSGSVSLSLTSKDPAANYHLGRSLLIADRPEQAIYYLKQATKLLPNKAEYFFWRGVGHYAMMEHDLEKQSYMQAIELDPNYLSAYLYLGHNFMDMNLYNEALQQYDRVLEIDPGFLEALYGRGLVLGQLGKADEEASAWKKYLSLKITGKWAQRAVEHLNTSGDFSYRAHQLGFRKVVLRQIAFGPSGELTEQSCESLERIGQILINSPRLALHLVVYVKDNPVLAKIRVKSLKRFLVTTFPDVAPRRLKISWFGVPEVVSVSGKTYTQEESVLFIGQKEDIALTKGARI